MQAAQPMPGSPKTAGSRRHPPASPKRWFRDERWIAHVTGAW